MKIKQYQAGGGIIYTPFLPAQNEQSSSSNKTSSDDSVTKSLTDLIKSSNSMLPSDADVLLNAVSSISNKYRYNPTGQQYSFSDIAALQKLAVRGTYNKSLADKAASNIQSQQLGQEYAYTDDGRLWAENLTNKQLTQITPEELLSHRDSYRLIKTNELLVARANDGPLALRSDILESMSNQVGEETVNKMIYEIIGKFGTSKSDHYTVKNGDQIEQGLEYTLGLGEDGYYKITKEITNGTETGQDLMAAADYIYRSLTRPAQTYYDVNLALEGINPNDRKARNAFILQSLILNGKRNISASYESQMTKAAIAEAGGGESNGGGKTVYNTLGERYQYGTDWGNWGEFEIFSKGSNTRYVVKGTQMGTLMSMDEKAPLSDMNLSQVRQYAAGVAGSTKWNSVSFGDIPLDENDWTKVVYDSSRPLGRVWMPYKVDSQNRILPDFDSFEKLEKLKSQIKPGMTEGQINGLIKNSGLNVTYKDGEFKFLNQRPFMVFTGVSSSALLHELKDAKFVKHLDKSELTLHRKLYNQLTDMLAVNGQKDANLDAGNRNTWFNNKFYRAMVYIPILEGSQATAVYQGSLHPASEYMNIDQQVYTHQYKDTMESAVEAAKASGKLKTTFNE